MYAIIEDGLVALDPYTGVVGEMDEDKVMPNLPALLDTIDRLEATAGDLLNSLDPTTTPRDSYPNREGIYLNLGRVTNFGYGFALGLVLSALILLVV